jgi:ribosomal subunit interface protein
MDVMQLQIESPHFKPGEELNNLIQRKFEHLGKRYERINHCEVLLRKENSDTERNSFMEAKMEVPGRLLFASDKDETFEMALDKVIHDLEHQLRRYKEELDERR